MKSGIISQASVSHQPKSTHIKCILLGVLLSSSPSTSDQPHGAEFSRPLSGRFLAGGLGLSKILTTLKLRWWQLAPPRVPVNFISFVNLSTTCIVSIIMEQTFLTKTFKRCAHVFEEITFLEIHRYTETLEPF